MAMETIFGPGVLDGRSSENAKSKIMGTPAGPDDPGKNPVGHKRSKTVSGPRTAVRATSDTMQDDFRQRRSLS